MLVTVLAVFVTNILYLSTLSLGTNIQKMSPKPKNCHQHIVINTHSSPRSMWPYQSFKCSHVGKSSDWKFRFTVILVRPLKKSSKEMVHTVWIILYDTNMATYAFDFEMALFLKWFILRLLNEQSQHFFFGTGIRKCATEKENKILWCTVLSRLWCQYYQTFAFMWTWHCLLNNAKFICHFDRGVIWFRSNA